MIEFPEEEELIVPTAEVLSTIIPLLTAFHFFPLSESSIEAEDSLYETL